MNWLKQIKTFAWLGLGVFFFVLMLRITTPYFSGGYDVDFLLTKQMILSNRLWRYSFYIHISTGILVLLCGIFQFPAYFLMNYPRVHRLMGKTYVLFVLLASAPSGLIMALYANGGLWAKCSFAILSLLWWYFTYMAYKYALKREFELHRVFMYRSFALTLSAITLRTYVLLVPHVIHLHGKDLYVFVAWASWIPNLVVVEILVRRLKQSVSELRS